MVTTSTGTITERLADYVVGLRFEDLPAAVVERAKELLGHHLGVALLGQGFEIGRQSVVLALEASGDDVGACSIVGERRRAALLEALFANSLLMTCVALVDTLPGGSVPGVVVQPTAWAVGETTGASGRDLLTAVVAGYDVIGRVFPSPPADNVDESPVWTWEHKSPRPLKMVAEPFGAAAAAARLYGLSREETVHALGHAGHAGMGLYEGFEHSWGLLHSLVARNGAMAALLAKSGMPGSPTILEGSHGVYRTYSLSGVQDAAEDGLGMLGHEFEISTALTTRHPVSRLNQIPIELAQQVVAEHAITPGRVAAIDLVLPEERRARESVYDNVSNYRGPSFLVSLVVTDGRLDVGRFKAPPDAEVISMREKVRLRFEEGRPLYFARVEVTTIDGEHYVAEGDTEIPPPLDWDELLIQSGREILPETQLTRLAELIRNLEEVPDVTEIMTCATPRHVPVSPIGTTSG